LYRCSEGDWEKVAAAEKATAAASENDIWMSLRGLSSGGGGQKRGLPAGTTRKVHKVELYNLL
jgi:hypothetical protein